MSEHRFCGLDGEMTGGTKTLHFFDEYQLCQIGIALSYDDIFTRDIGYKEGEYKVTEEALEVNKFTHERIQSGPSQWQVDSELVQWVRERVPAASTPYGLKLIAVGWNVSSWDMPFVRRYLPRFAEWVWYRAVDLNSVVFTAQKVTGQSYDAIKGGAKQYAEYVLSKKYPESKWHDAGYDAAASLAAWDYLVKLLKPTLAWKVDFESTANL